MFIFDFFLLDRLINAYRLISVGLSGCKKCPQPLNVTIDLRVYMVQCSHLVWTSLVTPSGNIKVTVLHESCFWGVLSCCFI